MPAEIPPSNHTPLAGLAVVSLDLETTGLDVRRDRIIQIGAVALDGARILEQPRLDQRIDPGMSIPPTAARITGLSDTDLAGAPSLAACWPALLQAISGRVVIGHHVAFDLAILRNEAARLGIDWSDPPSLDIAHLLGGLDPTLPDLGLETITEALGVVISKRHDALGDAMGVAEVFVHLLERLRNAEIRTLGEALALADRRQDLKLREAEAGWHGAPGTEARPPGPVRLDGVVFSRRVDEVMSAPPVTVASDCSVLDAARVMVERRIGAVLVENSEDASSDRLGLISTGVPAGIVTERDLLTIVAGDEATPSSIRIDAIMSRPVQAIADDELLYRALGRMDRLGVRHLAVIGRDGAARGMVSQRDLLHHRARAEVLIDDAVGAANTSADLAIAFARVTDAAQGLLADGLDGVAIARVVSRELRAVTAQAATLALARLAEEGMGPAPAPWSLLVLGSGGRGESLLGADQDNALIHVGSISDDPWFAAFGAHIADILDGAGVPRCTGGVMAANAPWRGTEAVWRSRVEDWVRRARPQDLLNVDIFFDLRPVAGAPELGEQLRLEAIVGAAESRPFLGLMARSVSNISPQFGFLGGLILQDGRIDLKRQGLLPLVSLARALALACGSAGRSTHERLLDVVAAGRIGETDATALSALQGEIMTLMLRQQLADLDAGVKPSSRVALAGLPRGERAELKDGLKRLAAIVGDVRGLMAR